MYKYLKKIPTKEYECWSNEFYETHKDRFDNYDREVLINIINEFIENLTGESSNITEIIMDYKLTIAVRDFLHIILKRDRDRLVNTYPEAFI